jgi:hydroxymethylpyrimidine pyrophosphatase-like HAD family hydrolase
VPPRYRALACDYDGTVASKGRVNRPTRTALERLRAGGRRLILVTGRQLADLAAVLPQLELFDRIVAENGAVLHRPHDGTVRRLAAPPSAALVDCLERRGVAPISVGLCIVATRVPHQTAVVEAIRELGLALRVIFNQGAVMVLPLGVDKATGLEAALAELRVPPAEVVGVGDAENDGVFLDRCGCAVAVANAVEALRARADLVTSRAFGAGVAELIDRLLADDPALVASRPIVPRRRPGAAEQPSRQRPAPPRG